MTYFTTINNISKSVQRSNLSLTFFKAASYARSDAVINRSVSSSYILRNIFRKFFFFLSFFFHFKNLILQ